MPLRPKAASKALSSNSPATRGRRPCRSNHWSSRGRTAAWPVGSSTGMSRQACREGLLAIASPVAAGANQRHAALRPARGCTGAGWGWAAPPGPTAPRPAGAAPGRPAGGRTRLRGTAAARRGSLQRRLQQVAHHQLGQAVGDAHRQPQALAGGGVAHGGGQLFAQLEDLVGVRHGGHAGFGQRHAAPGRLEQRVAQRLLERAHLRADRLHRHVQPGGGAGHAAFLGDDPEVVEVPVVERGGHARSVPCVARARPRAASVKPERAVRGCWMPAITQPPRPARGLVRCQISSRSSGTAPCWSRTLPVKRTLTT